MTASTSPRLAALVETAQRFAASRRAPLAALLERGESRLVEALFALPEPAMSLLAGGRAPRSPLPGLELAPESKLAVMLNELLGGPGFDAVPVAELREAFERTTRLASGRLVPVHSTEELTLPGPAGPLAARLYRPRRLGAARGLLVYFHGGGCVVGSLASHEAPCRYLADRAGVLVLATRYRLAPEHRFPAAAEDAFAAFRWAVEHASALDARPTHVAVGGDSAGGYLSAVVAQLARADGGPAPAAQLLLYPGTDLGGKQPSHRLFREGYLLCDAQIDWYRDQYLPSAAAALDPLASPLRAHDQALAGLAPAIVATAGFDPLRDEAEAYAARLARAGVRVALRRYDGLLHGFANTVGIAPRAPAAMQELAGLLVDTLQSAPA